MINNGGFSLRLKFPITLLKIPISYRDLTPHVRVLRHFYDLEISEQSSIFQKNMVWEKNSLLDCTIKRWMTDNRLDTVLDYACKVKVISAQTWTNPEGSRSLRVTDFKTIGTWRW